MGHKIIKRTSPNADIVAGVSGDHEVVIRVNDAYTVRIYESGYRDGLVALVEHDGGKSDAALVRP